MTQWSLKSVPEKHLTPDPIFIHLQAEMLHTGIPLLVSDILTALPTLLHVTSATSSIASDWLSTQRKLTEYLMSRTDPCMHQPYQPWNVNLNSMIMHNSALPSLCKMSPCVTHNPCKDQAMPAVCLVRLHGQIYRSALTRHWSPVMFIIVV